MYQIYLVVVASFVRVPVLVDCEYSSDSDVLDPQFLFQLTPQRDRCGLAWLDVTAGKEVPNRSYRLRQQEPRALGDNSAHDQLDLRKSHSRTLG